MKRYLAPLGAILLLSAAVVAFAQTRTQTQRDIFTRFTNGLSPIGGLKVPMCGENAENGTIYFTPVGLTFEEPVIGSAACDAFDGATEATQDTASSSIMALRPLYMRCQLQGTLGAGETMAWQLRAAEADVLGMTCSLTAGQTICEVKGTPRTIIPAGTPMAMRAIQVSDNADDNSKCNVYFTFD